MPSFPDPFGENPSNSPDLLNVGDVIERGQPGRSGLIPVYMALPPRGQTAQIVAVTNAGLTTITYYTWSGSAWVAVGSGGTTDRIQDADNDTFSDAEVGTDPDFITTGVPATSTIFEKYLKGAEAQPRVQVQDDGLVLGSGAAAGDVHLRRGAADVMSLHDNNAGDALEFRVMTAPATPAGNNMRLYVRILGSSAATFVKDQNGAEYGPIGEKMQATVGGRGPSGGMEPPGSTTWSDGVWGTLAPAGLWTPTGTPSVGDDLVNGRGRYMQMQSGAVIGNDAGVESAARFSSFRGDAYLIRFRLPDTTSVRFFAGIAAQSLATMVGADDPGTNHLGLQFSTPRGDTNWKFIERATGAQTVTDTGVAVSTEPMYIQIFTGTFFQAVLLDSSFTPLATRTVGIFNRPTGLVSIILGVETRAAAARSIQWYHINNHGRIG